MANVRIITASILGAGAIGASSFGIVHAATANQNVGSSGIPRSTFAAARLDAEASVLHTTTTAVTTARHNHTFRTLVSQAGLTEQTFRQQVKTDMTAELEKDGYSQDQITIAFQHRTILRLRYDERHEAKMGTNSTAQPAGVVPQAV